MAPDSDREAQGDKAARLLIRRINGYDGPSEVPYLAGGLRLGETGQLNFGKCWKARNKQQPGAENGTKAAKMIAQHIIAGVLSMAIAGLYPVATTRAAVNKARITIPVAAGWP